MSKTIVMQRLIRLAGTVTASTTEVLTAWAINNQDLASAVIDVTGYADAVFTLHVVDGRVPNANDEIKLQILTADSLTAIRNGQGTSGKDSTNPGPNWVVKEFSIIDGTTDSANEHWQKHSTVIRTADDSDSTHPLDAMLYFAMRIEGGTGGDEYYVTFALEATLMSAA